MELSMLHWIQTRLANPTLNTIVPFITSLGNHAEIWFAIIALMLIQKHHRREGYAVAVALLLTYVVTVVVMKNIICRPRPFLVDTSFHLLIDPPGEWSFPSGHAATSFAAATAITYSSWPRRIKVGAFITATLIAASRLYLCVHYPTDVLVGALIGTALAIFTAKTLMPAVWVWWDRRTQTHPSET